MPDEKRHSIFMTHGGQLTLTILSRKLYTDDFHWIIKYDGATKEYRFLSDKMNFGFRDDELHSIFRTPLIGEEDITQRLDNTLLSTVFYSLDSLFIFIKTYAPSIRMIALDANLTDIGGYEFRPEAHQALILSGAERALLFSEKEHCIDDTNRYLDGAHQNLALRPPTSLKHVIVSMRKNFPKEFAFRELPQQVVAKVATVSNRHSAVTF